MSFTPLCNPFKSPRSRLSVAKLERNGSTGDPCQTSLEKITSRKMLFKRHHHVQGLLMDSIKNRSVFLGHSGAQHTGLHGWPVDRIRANPKSTTLSGLEQKRRCSSNRVEVRSDLCSNGQGGIQVLPHGIGVRSAKEDYRTRVVWNFVREPFPENNQSLIHTGIRGPLLSRCLQTTLQVNSRWYW